MSGPIVRKYGFPNFEKIFGERELKHGAEGEAEAPPTSPTPAEAPRASDDSKPGETGVKPSKP